MGERSASALVEEVIARQEAIGATVLDDLIAEDVVNDAAGPQGRQGLGLILQTIDGDVGIGVNDVSSASRAVRSAVPPNQIVAMDFSVGCGRRGRSISPAVVEHRGPTAATYASDEASACEVYAGQRGAGGEECFEGVAWRGSS